MNPTGEDVKHIVHDLAGVVSASGDGYVQVMLSTERALGPPVGARVILAWLVLDPTQSHEGDWEHVIDGRCDIVRRRITPTDGSDG